MLHSNVCSLVGTDSFLLLLLFECDWLPLAFIPPLLLSQVLVLLPLLLVNMLHCFQYQVSALRFSYSDLTGFVSLLWLLLLMQSISSSSSLIRSPSLLMKQLSTYCYHFLSIDSFLSLSSLSILYTSLLIRSSYLLISGHSQWNSKMRKTLINK